MKPPTTIPLSVPEINSNEWKYIKSCLDSNWVSSVGSYVNEFEANFASLFKNKIAVATSSGTSALHIALIVTGVLPDEEVIVPSLTFIAPANAVRYVNAWPLFVDIEENHWQIDINKLHDFLHNECYWKNARLINKLTGRMISAIIPVDLLGHPSDYLPIMELARKFDLKVIEDATESLGARYNNDPVGTQGDIACFSFNGNKIITSGGGGMLITSNSEWAFRAKHLSTQAISNTLEYNHDEIGFNYRLTNIQAAMGVAQLENLEENVKRKRANAKRYTEAFFGVAGIKTPREASWAFGTYWLYTILKSNGWRELHKHLSANGIESRPLWQPLHKSRAHRDSCSYRVEVADKVAEKALSIPSSVGLTKVQQDLVIQKILDFSRS